MLTKACCDFPRHPTSAVTLLSVIVCLVLIASEVYRFMVPKQKEHMVVDPVIEGA